MPGNPARKGLRDCCAAEVMNELVVGTPNPRDVEELAHRAFDIVDAMLGESDRPVPRPEGSSGIGVDAWIRTGPVDSEIAARPKCSVEPR